MTNATLDDLNVVMAEAEGHGVTFSEGLKGTIRDAENPHYTIGVVGRFQVGKSTLINRVFLRRPLLTEGEGLCTTAVCTEVTYGPQARAALKRAGAEAVEKTDPTNEDLRQWTTAEGEEARARLAREVERLRIETPNEALRPYTILDTPGIDDPNEAVLDQTTYRQLPTCDLVLLVAEAKQLSQVEVQFLSGVIFRAGLTKAMLLLSYNKAKGKLSAAARANIVETVQAQLASLGLGDIPVRMVCYSGDAPDILDTPEKVEADILGYLRQTVEAGRLGRLRSQVKVALLQRCNELDLLRTLALKSREERLRLRGEMEDELSAVGAKLLAIRKQIDEALAGVVKTNRKTLADGLKALRARVLAGEVEGDAVRGEVDALAAEVLAAVRKDCDAALAAHAEALGKTLEEFSEFIKKAHEGEPTQGGFPFIITENPVFPCLPYVFDWKTVRDVLDSRIVKDTVEAQSREWAENLQDAADKATTPTERALLRLGGELVAKLPDFIGKLRDYAADKSVGATLDTMEAELCGRVEAVVRHFRRATKAYIDQCEEAERAKVKRAFDEALDEKPDDPEAIRRTIEALQALAARL